MSAGNDLFSFDSSQKKQLARLVYAPDALVDAINGALAMWGNSYRLDYGVSLDVVMAFYFEALFPVIVAPREDPGDGVTIWIDGWVLKVASGP